MFYINYYQHTRGKVFDSIPRITIPFFRRAKSNNLRDLSLLSLTYVYAFYKLENFSRIERNLILFVPRKVVFERNISSRAISKREIF